MTRCVGRSRVDRIIGITLNQARSRGYIPHLVQRNTGPLCEPLGALRCTEGEDNRDDEHDEQEAQEKIIPTHITSENKSTKEPFSIVISIVGVSAFPNGISHDHSRDPKSDIEIRDGDYTRN